MQPSAASTAGTQRAGVAGLGMMGASVAERLLATGLEVTGYDPDPVAAERAEAAGLDIASSLAELAGSARTIVCCLPSPEILAEAVLGTGGLLRHLAPGAVVVDLGTDGPDVLRRCESAALDRGVHVVDAAVGRGPAAAREGRLIVLAAGRPEAVAAARPVLELLGEEIHDCGPCGAGQAAKIVNNLVAGANLGILAEAFALGEAYGVDRATLARIMTRTAADSWQLRNCLEPRTQGGMATDPQANRFEIRHGRKDLKLAADLLAGCGLATTAADRALHWYDRAIAAGFAQHDQRYVAPVEHVADPD